MNNDTIKKALAFTMATAMATTITTGCTTSKAQKLVNYLDDNKYEDAVTYYSQWEITDKEYTELVQVLTEKLDALVKDYANEEIKYDDAIGIINTISKFTISELTQDIAVTSASISELKTSKKMYKDGMKYYEKKDYANTLRCLGAVVENDKNYQSAKETFDTAEKDYIKKTIKDAKKSAKDEKFEVAIASLEECLQYINDEAEVNKELTSIKKEYDSFKFKIAKKSLVTKVEELAKAGNYEESLTNINEFVEEYGSDKEVKKLQSTCEENYISMITTKVEALRTEKKYLVAIEMLTNAKNIVSSTKFDDLMKVLEQEKPVYLCDLKYQSSNRYTQITEGEVPTDTIGNNYEFGNTFEMSSNYASWSHDNGYVDYYLGYKYTKMHGVISVSDTSDETSCVLTIEGDGKELYSLEINRLTTPTAIDIDVSSVNYIKIKMGDVQSGTLTSILSDFYFVI